MEYRTDIIVILLVIASSVVYGNDIRCYSCDDCTKEEPTIVQCSAKNGLDLGVLSYTPSYPWAVNPWDPILTPPTYPPQNGGGNQLYPWDPMLTPPPLVGGNNGDAWYPGYPILTPPPLVGGNNGGAWYPGYPVQTLPPLNPWDPQLTPPPLVGGNNGGVWGPAYPYDPYNPYYPGYPGYPSYPGYPNNQYFPPHYPPNYPYYPYYPYGKAKEVQPSQKRFVCVTIRNQGKDASKDIVHRKGCAEIEGYAVGVCDREQMPEDGADFASCRVCGHALCNE